MPQKKKPKKKSKKSLTFEAEKVFKPSDSKEDLSEILDTDAARYQAKKGEAGTRKTTGGSGPTGPPGCFI